MPDFRRFAYNNLILNQFLKFLIIFEMNIYGEGNRHLMFDKDIASTVIANND